MSDVRFIYTNDEGGVCVVIPAAGVDLAEVVRNSIPEGKEYETVDVKDLPTDRTFRNAWEREGKAIRCNLTKCKALAHDKRRTARSAEFAPLDIEATIPMKAQEAEAKRQAVRDKYAAIQERIDGCDCVEDLKTVLEDLA